MSIYETGNSQLNNGELTQTEAHLYGSSRLGIFTLQRNVENPASGTGGIGIFERGRKFFELSNHLGNVLVTISDKKLGHDAGNGTVDYYTADVVTASDYYPFGMQMPSRKYSAGTQYRYGFNGKENDNEVKGDGNQQDYGMRIYDPRLGRFLSVDPITADYPELTPYQFASNSPVTGSDLDGLEFEDRKAIEAELAKMRIEKQQQVKQKAEIKQKVSAGGLLKDAWRGMKDSYKATKSTFSSSSIKGMLNDAAGTANDIGGMIVGKPGAAKSFSERTFNFSMGVSNSISEPVTFLGTIHTSVVNTK